MQKRIDINVDVGEGFGNEAEIMPYISSCNIACGGHAGDINTMRTVVGLAKKHRVKVGAHPSFPDKTNFGREVMDMSCVALYSEIKNQIEDLILVLKEQHLQLHHVKPHGALYNLAAVHEKTAKVIIEVMKGLMLPAKLYVPYNSVIANLATKNNLNVLYEAFADRNYNEDLTLVSRKALNATIQDTHLIFEHVFSMICSEHVTTLEGKRVFIKADTYCLHGDNPNIVDIVSSLKRDLESKGVLVV